MPSRPPRVARSLALSLAIVAAALALAAPAGADPPVPGAKPPGCTAAPHRQFDFWLGEWDVTDGKGKVAGRNRIVALHDGCVLQESWNGSGGFSGTSLNAYDAERGKWHQTWVDNNGGVLQLDGEFTAGKMVLRGGTLDEGKKVLQRISWQPLPDGRVRQLWESSKDGGGTWTVAFDGYYARR